MFVISFVVICCFVLYLLEQILRKRSAKRESYIKYINSDEYKLTKLKEQCANHINSYQSLVERYSREFDFSQIGWMLPGPDKYQLFQNICNGKFIIGEDSTIKTKEGFKILSRRSFLNFEYKNGPWDDDIKTCLIQIYKSELADTIKELQNDILSLETEMDIETAKRLYKAN